MKFELDKFNGIIIGREDVPADVDTFHAQLADIVALAHAEAKNIIWLTLPIGLSHLVPIATELGFVFHNCLEDEVTLIHKAPSTTFIPFIPTHTLGAGAITDHTFNPTLLFKKAEQRRACLSAKMKLTLTPVQTRTTRLALGSGIDVDTQLQKLLFPLWCQARTILRKPIVCNE